MTFITDLGPGPGDARWRAAQAALSAGRTRILHVDTGLAPHPGLGFKPDGTPPANILMDEGLNWHDPSSGRRGPLTDLSRGDGPIAGATEFPDHGVKTLSVILADGPDLRGVAPGAHVVPHRVANGPVFRGKARTANIGAAIDHALKRPNPPRVISISMGNPGFLGFYESLRRLLSGETVMAPATREAIDRAYEAGVIVVCAAGQIIDRMVYPARFSRTIAVGGFRRDGAVVTHYPRGGYADMTRVDVWAVAEDVNRASAHLGADGRPVYAWAASPEGETGEVSGTSYACPQVAGAAALWVETHHDALEAAFGAERWRMVEAFRLALKRSAEAAVAEEAGPDGPEPIRVLDIERLLATPPDADAAMRKRGSATEEGVW